MTEGKHTPWHLEDGANSHVFDGRVVDPDGVTLAFVTLGSQSARLIAAASELLELVDLLEAASVDISGTALVMPHGMNAREVKDRLRAALAKATGAS